MASLEANFFQEAPCDHLPAELQEDLVDLVVPVSYLVVLVGGVVWLLAVLAMTSVLALAVLSYELLPQPIPFPAGLEALDRALEVG